MSRKGVSYSELVHQAMDFASRIHEGRFRKNKNERIPYFSHCAMVGYLLERAGFDEATVAAGILHDTVEDGGVSLNTLEGAFGKKVAELVGHVTEKDKTLPWEERKALYLAHLREAPFEALAVTCADKIHNLWSMIHYVRSGQDVWSILSRGRELQMKRFEKMADLFKQRFDHPLREAYEEALDILKTECG
jgi:(p)ppGpp synthase/HD superfamily hydrolase